MCFCDQTCYPLSELGDNFTVAQALKTGGALTQLETAVDIKIDKFRSGHYNSIFFSVSYSVRNH